MSATCFPHPVVHLDADAFFAAVEQAADPRLRGRPVAVGGERRGIIASASYEARRLGVYTPMPTARARRLCPRLIVLPGDFAKYEQFSRWMFSYAYDFTPEVEVCSIDEGYFDLSGVRRPAVEVAATIRDAIRQSLKISVSEGIGSNKLISQIASKLHKPAAFECVPPGQEIPFLHPLPNQWLPGIGPKTAERLNAAGLALIRQVAATPVELLSLLVGRAAPQVKQFAQGIDERPVVPASEPAKSYSHQRTFAQDQTDETFLAAVLRRMADDLFTQARADGHSVRTLTVKVRYNDMAEDQAGESLHEPTDLETDVYAHLSRLLQRAWHRRVSVRLVALKLSNLYQAFPRTALPLDRASEQHEARRRLAGIVDRLRAERGYAVLLRGHDLLLRAGEPDPMTSGECRVPKAASEGDVACRDHELTRVRSAGFIRQGTADAAVRPDKSGVPGCRFTERAWLPARPPKGAIPLVVRSHYSFLNSTLAPAAIVAWAQQHDLPAIALCDQGNLHGAVEFALAAQAAGIRPILGAEIRLGAQPLWLYVENATGYANLCRLLSDTATATATRATEARRNLAVCERERVSGGQDCPRSVHRLAVAALANAGTDGLLAVSADLTLAPLFPGRFYRAITCRRELDRYEARASRLPAVPVVPVHYATRADRWKFEVVQSIRTLTLLRQTHPAKLLGGRYHFRAPSEWADLFGRHAELLVHTQELADRCRFAFVFGQPQFPDFQTPDGSTPRAFLRALVFRGLAARYGERGAATREGGRVTLAELRRQAEEELHMIHVVGYEEYFLVVWDILQACRGRGIEWITRGSAADSLVCYCLGISDVCPIRFELYFRRFLNAERMALNKLPDIDIDFPHDRKDDVLDLIFARYGRAHCAIVGGFSTFQARSAFAEVAKVLGVAEREVRRFTDHFPWRFGGGWQTNPPDAAPAPRPKAESGTQKTESLTLHSALSTPHSSESRLARLLRASPECADLPLAEEPYRSALIMAEFLAGVPRYPKMHPCGVVLSRQLLTELTPTFVASKGYPTTHFDMDAVEALGLVKMDILAQGGLAAMRDAKASLCEQGLVLDLQRFTVRRVLPSDAAGLSGALREPEPQTGHSSGPGAGSAPPASERFDDPAVWDLIASGQARAVHHIESPAMISLCRMCDVRDIDTLIAVVSVIRPGAANEDKKREFTRRYQGLSPVTYPHASLEPCLRSTFGLVVYEEHILQICEAFAGLPSGQADVLRRALVKEKLNVVAEIGREFGACARRRGRTEDEIERVWKLVTGFHGYAFCRAHSTAYGVEAYQSAWLKHYFPAEFLAAVLTQGKGFYRPLVYVLECWRLGIPLLPPWVNEPGPAFRVVPTASVAPAVASPPPGTIKRRGGSAIRVPVTYIQSLTRATQERLLAERAREPFASLADFHRRVQPTPDEMETLIRAGACDGFGGTRCEQFWEAQHLRARGEHGGGAEQGWLIPPPSAFMRREPDTEPGSETASPQESIPHSPALPDSRLHLPLLQEPTRLQRLRWEMELLGFPASGHPFELYPDTAWETYCPVTRLGEFVGEEVTLCGLVVEDRVHHQVTGEPMKFLTLADWTGMVETELFAPTYRAYGLTTVRYPVLEVTGRVEPFENGRGYTLRVLRAGRPRRRTHAMLSASSS
jgi:DNA-directed DNA polymerase III PolC